MPLGHGHNRFSVHRRPGRCALSLPVPKRIRGHEPAETGSAYGNGVRVYYDGTVR